MKTTRELTDRAYEEYLKPYYENLTREKAVIGSLFSVDTSVFTDDELKRFVSTLVRDFLEVAVTERHLYHVLLPILNDYPLKSVTIHPRTQQQQYLGKVNLSDFDFFATKLKHTIIYNGDIFSTNDFKRLKTQFPFIKHWMIGRGVLQNPFLAAEIRGISYDKKQLLPVYIDLLQENFIASLYRYNETTILNKMKEFTKYLSIGFSFDATELLRMVSLDEFNKALHKISV